MRVLLIAIFASASLLTSDVAQMDLKERPVSKVIKLLKDMKATLEKEKAEDEELFEKMSCWCETNEKEKNAAVEVANKQIDGLVADIEKHSGMSAQLQAEIAQLEKEIAENTKALDTATAVREKELEEFQGNEKDLVNSLAALKNAILVLSKHHSAFLQGPVSTEVKKAVQAVLSQTSPKAAPAQHLQRQLAGLLQGKQPGLTNSGSYTPASGQIFGILNQMKDEFESNLSQMQKDEAQAQVDFAQLKKAKQAEIAAGKAKLKEKTFGLADSDDFLATAKEDLGMTREALASDVQFIQDLRLRCQQSDKDWELRSKTRAEEIAAIADVIAMLSDDDAFDLFGKTVDKPSVFVQTRASKRAENAKRARVVGALKAVAQKSGSREVLALAAQAQLDAFAKVKAMIDEMVTVLKKDQEDEVKHRDFCVEEFDENEKSTLVKENEIKDLEGLIAKSEATMKTLTEEMEALKSSIKEMQKQMAKASEDRELENKDFQTVVADQRATQEILQKALKRLESFYKKALLQAQANQEPGAAVPPPPPAFKAYKKNEGSSGVMTMIENVIKEAAASEAEAIKDEADSQAGYEEFIKNSNDAIAKANSEIVAKTEQKAETEATMVQAKADLESAVRDSAELAAYKAELHDSCDFVLKNFDTRQAARMDEIEGLQKAKAILSGSEFAEF
jgi:chromosome segregation ATPase